MDNVGYGEELDNDLRSSFANIETWIKPNPRNTKKEEYINDEDGTLNRRGQKYLNRLKENNEEFRDEIINFVRDKTELDLDMI